VVAANVVAETGTWPRLRALFERSPEPFRAEAVDGLLGNNDGNREIYDYVVALTKHPSKELRLAAVGAFWVGMESYVDECCRLLDAHFDDPDEDIAAVAVYHAADFEAKCAAHYDRILASVERRQKAGTIRVHGFGLAVASLLEEPPRATDVQRKRANAVCRLIAEDARADDASRMSCMDSLHSVDPPGAAAMLRKLTKDRSPKVTDRAKLLLGQ
jgi:hypothetical protein